MSVYHSIIEPLPFWEIPDPTKKAVLEDTKTTLLAPWERLVTAFENSNMEERQKVFYEFLANPQEFTELVENGSSSRSYLKGFSFFECSCTSYGRHVNKCRQNAEALIVEDIEKRFVNKNEVLSLVSYGAGGLLQDLIIVGKLIQNGFRNIYIEFIDLNFDSLNGRKFAEMLNKLPEIFVQTVTRPMMSSKKQFDVIYSVDLDEIYKGDGKSLINLLKARKMLKDNGKIYFFGNRLQIVLDKDGSFTDIMEDSDVLTKTISHHPQFGRLSNVEKISLLITKEYKLNFDIPAIAKVLQFLSRTFDKMIIVNIYGNESYHSDLSLNEWGNQFVLQNLSGVSISRLVFRYHKESFSEEQQRLASTTQHIFIREFLNRKSIVDFGQF